MISTSSALTSLKAYITLHGLTTVPVHLSGKVHNPENVELATRLQSLYHQNRLLMLEAPRTLKKVRSNASGRLMPEGSATNQVIDTILTSSCQWHEIMTIVAQELLHTGRRIHAVASFGLADCVPLAAFHEAGLEIVKIVGDELAETPTLAPVPAEIANNMTRVPSVEPVAIFGMACRALRRTIPKSFGISYPQAVLPWWKYPRHALTYTADTVLPKMLGGVKVENSMVTSFKTSTLLTTPSSL